MNDFEERYKEYLAKNRGIIGYKLWEARSKNHSNFRYDMDGYGLATKIGFIPFIGLLALIVFCLSIGSIVLKIVSVIVMVGMGAYLYCIYQIVVDRIADYFFDKYEYKRIIEERVDYDMKNEIEELLLSGESYDLERKYREIKNFYCECKSRLLNEDLEKKQN